MFGFGKKVTVELKVTGMHCPKCQKKVLDALNAVKGCKAEVDLEGAKATVMCPEGTDAAVLIAAVKAVGFDASL